MDKRTQELLDPQENRMRKVGVTLVDLEHRLHGLGEGRLSVQRVRM